MITEEQVYEVLTRLHDRVYLQAREEGALVDLALHYRGDATEGQRPEAVRQMLAEALRGLRPSPSTPVDDPAWRPWTALRLRFVEQMSPTQVQERMGLSERQVRREQSRGITALTAILNDMAGSLGAEVGADTDDSLAQAAGALDFFPTLVDARQVLQDVASMVQPRYEDQGSTLALPQEAPAVYADRVALRQVFSRVLSELAPLAARGEVRVQAEATAGEAAYRFRLPQGAVIPPSSAFVAECAYLAELTLGAVELEDERTIRCTFPLRRPAQLLLIDDEPVAARLLRRCVQGQGIRVTAATSPMESVREAIALQPDVIVLDVLMPGTDGWEVLQQLRATPETQQIPVIVCSVWKDPDLALSLGASDFVRKPITRPRLLLALSRVLPSIAEEESPPE